MGIYPLERFSPKNEREGNSMAYKVVVTDYNFESIDPYLRELADIEDLDVTVYQKRTQDSAELIQRVKDANVVFVHFAAMTAEVIKAMKCCKMIVRPAIGFDNIDVDAATEQGIYVVNIPEYGAQYDVSNHVMMLMLACEKKLWKLASSTKKGIWNQNLAKPVRRLNGQTFGLCGFGRIPKRVASKAQAFDMDVIAYDPYVDAEAMRECGVRKVDFETLCRKSDVISITLPLTAETKYLFNESAFKMMKPSAFIINTARGAVIKEADLIKALENGEIAGAGLDVVENENLPAELVLPADHPFNHMDNVIVTPHSGWLSEDAEISLLSQCGQQTVEVYRNGKPTHSVNAV